MIIKRKYCFLIVFCITMLSLFFSICDFVPLAGIMQKVKFIYIIFCLVDMFAHRVPYKHLKMPIIFVVIVYILFCILYGKIWVTPTVVEETAYQFKTTLLMLWLIFLTYYEVEYYDCFIDFVHCSFLSCAFFLLLCYVTHIGESSFNPLYILKIMFSGDSRGRAEFGLGHWNYVGFYCYVTGILSYLCFKTAEIFGEYKKIYRYCIIVIDFILYMMLVSASSRAPILSMTLFAFILCICKLLGKFKPSFRIVIILFVIITVIIVAYIMVVSGFWNHIWENSSRSMNITVNMPIFEKYGDFWKGMGWVETGALQSEYDAFGVGTSSLDMFYVYVYFTTGFIGCVMLGIVYLTMGLSILTNWNIENREFFLALFGSLLFYLYWETILFTIKFWPGLIIIVLLFHGMGRVRRKYYSK